MRSCTALPPLARITPIDLEPIYIFSKGHLGLLTNSLIVRPGTRPNNRVPFRRPLFQTVAPLTHYMTQRCVITVVVGKAVAAGGRAGAGGPRLFDRKNSAAGGDGGFVIASSCLWRFALFGWYLQWSAAPPSASPSIPAHIGLGHPAIRLLRYANVTSLPQSLISSPSIIGDYLSPVLGFKQHEFPGRPDQIQ